MFLKTNRPFRQNGGKEAADDPIPSIVFVNNNNGTLNCTTFSRAMKYVFYQTFLFTISFRMDCTKMCLVLVKKPMSITSNIKTNKPTSETAEKKKPTT